MAAKGVPLSRPRLCIFCASSLGVRSVFAESARQVAMLAVRRGWDIVYGGAHCGLMGLVADTALAAGGAVYGAIPADMMDRELAHSGLTELAVVGSMHERKAQMERWSDAFLALPGGYGTYDELMEILTWAQLKIHSKPCGLLNVEGFYDPLLAQLDLAVAEGFLNPAYRNLLITETDPERLLLQLLQRR